MSPTPIPKYIDDPPHLLLWSADEFVPLALALLVGIFLDQKLICLAAGLLAVRFYRRYRDGRPDGLPLHALYWLGLYPSKAFTIPNPFIRRFYP